MGNWNRISEAQRDKIIALALAGNPPFDIVRSEGVHATSDQIYQILVMARKRGVPIQRFPPHRRGKQRAGGVVVRVALWQADHLAALDAAAEARGLNRSHLVNKLVLAALDWRLIDNILDDGVQSQ